MRPQGGDVVSREDPDGKSPLPPKMSLKQPLILLEARRNMAISIIQREPAGFGDP